VIINNTNKEHKQSRHRPF